MKRILLVLFFMVTLPTFGCSQSKNVASMLQSSGIKDINAIEKMEIQYLTKKQDGQVLAVTLDNPDSVDYKDILQSILKADPFTLNSDDTPFSAPLQSSHRILLSTAERSPLTLYFAQDKGWIIYIEKAREGKKELIKYHYLKAPSQLFGILEKQELYAATHSDLKANPIADISVADISKEDLMIKGKEIEYEISGNSYTEKSKTALYHAFNYNENEKIPEDKILVVASRGEMAKTGYEIDIDRIEANDDYIKVFITLEDPGEDTVSSITPDYPTVSVLCNKADFTPEKIVVFLDDENNIISAHSLQ